MNLTIFTIDVRKDGVAVVTMDDREQALNTITRRFGEELRTVLEGVSADPAIRCAVLVSGKKDSFIVGANIDMLRSITLASEAEALARDASRGFATMRGGSKPVVAAVHGPALGGGFELALACHAIVASDDSKTAVGLPEVQLGLIPAANGLLRVAERAGLQVALDLGLTGKHTRAAKAKKLGLVDEVCPHAVLLEAACTKALALTGPKKPVKKQTSLRAERTETSHSLRSVSLATLALEKNALGRKVLFSKAREKTRAKTRDNYPATERILDVLECFGKRGFAGAAELEAKSFGQLVVSECAHRLIEVFFAMTALKKDTGVDDAAIVPRPIERLAMVGGGLMGGGIAYITISSGIPVRLKDKDDAGIARGMKYVREILDTRVKRRALTPAARDQVFALLTTTTDMSGMRSCDIVVEAVFEDLALKHRILKEVEAATKDTCIFASNTSSIPITRIAEASVRPHNVVGMHYFSPVHKMPLLEVIRTHETSKEVITAAVALGKKQGKTVIVVKDGVGFYTSRILAPYMNEASFLLSEGVAVEAIDQALVDWGFPVGPVTLLDEVGIDVGAHVGKIMVEAFGSRLAPPPGMEKLLADDRKGRKNERGFYRYGKDAMKGGKRAVDTSVYKTLGVEPKTVGRQEEIQMRCALRMVNEALLCFGDGILRGPRDGDIGAIFGLGFPPFRGGPFRYVDSVGAGELLRRFRGYEDRFGARFTPAPVLVEMAAGTAKAFYGG